MEQGSEREIWIATEDFPPKLGGLSRWSENTAKTLARLDFTVKVLAKKADPTAHADAPYRVVPVTGRNFPKFRRYHFARAARELLRSGERPDWIIASTWHVGEAFAGRRIDIPFTVAVHGMEVFRPLGGGELRRLLKTLRRAGRVVAASRFTAQRVSDVCPGAGVVAGLNGVDLDLFSPTGEMRGKDHSVQLLSVGRLVQRKRFDLVIEALGLVRERGSDAGLWIVGEGPLEGELREHAEEMGLGDTVKFIGGMGDRDLAVFYRSSDLFISPCQSDLISGDVEGFGLTFAEAAACGTPSVALAEGGVTDAVEDGVSGILTTKEEFTETVAQLISDPERMEKLRHTARESAERRLDIRGIVPNLLPQQRGT